MLVEKTLALTGIKPTGTPHLGNLVGAIAPMVEFANKSEFDVNIFVADYHAINTPEGRARLKFETKSVVASCIAAGLRPDRCCIYRQSRVPQVFEFALFLMNFTPKGLVDRAHAYKAAVQSNIEVGQDGDYRINMGLYTYPILMAADILIFRANVVPVGRDQRQHIEFARDIAGSVNAIFPGLLELPEGFFHKENNEILGIDGRKMSKSYDNTIPIFGGREETKRAVMRIITDSKTPDEPKAEEGSVLLSIMQAVVDQDDYATFKERYLAGGIGYGAAKTLLADAIEQKVSAVRDKYRQLMDDEEHVRQILEEGEKRARSQAQKMIDVIHSRVFY